MEAKLFVFLILSLLIYSSLQTNIRALQITTDTNPSDGEILPIPGPPPTDESMTLTESDAREVVKQELQPLKVEISNANVRIHQSLDKTSKDMAKSLNETQDQINREINRMAYHMDKSIRHLEDQVDRATGITDDLSLSMYEEQIQEKTDELKSVNDKIKKLNEEIPQVSGNCDGASDCSGCLGLTGCGWCSMEQKCVNGDSIGPLYVNCNFYDFQTCRGQVCIHFIDCESCLQEPSCGWCDDRINNDEGCIEAGPDYQGCLSNGWFHTEGNSFPLNYLKGIQQQCERREYETKDQINGEQDREWEQDGDEEDGQLENDNYIDNEEQDRDWEGDAGDSQNEQSYNRQLEIDGLTPTEKEQLYSKVIDNYKQFLQKKKELKDNKKKQKDLERQIKQLKQFDKELKERIAVKKAQKLAESGDLHEGQQVQKDGESGEDGEDIIEPSNDLTPKEAGIFFYDGNAREDKQVQDSEDDEAEVIRQMLFQNEEDMDQFVEIQVKSQKQTSQKMQRNTKKKVQKLINKVNNIKY